MRQRCLERGPITHAVCEFFTWDPRPMRGARDHMLVDCTHAMDTVRWMCGGEVVRIESRCRRIGVTDINWIGATLHFDNGAVGLVVTSWCSGRCVRVQMHAPEICTDAEVEGRAHLYADGAYEPAVISPMEVAEKILAQALLRGE